MKNALVKFIESWKNRNEILGILLSGSYVMGLANENSDIDVRIVLSSEQDKNFKGLLEIDGYSFSYLGRTKKSIIKKFNDDFFNYSKIESRIFYVGQVLYEENNIIKEIKEVAEYYYNLPLIKKRNISEEDLKSMAYTLYSRYDYLLNTKIESPFFTYNYIIFMKFVIEFYASKMGVEMVMDTKLEKLITDNNYLKKYNFEPFPDKTFITLWVSSLALNNINKKSLNAVYNYVINKLYKMDKKRFQMYWVI